MKNKKKINLAYYTGSLKSEPRPKTLKECLIEAGGFPFSAKAIIQVPNAVWPVGIELQLIAQREDWDENTPVFISIPEKATEDTEGVIANVARWQLLGHKT
jgi:hypothetical protein